MNWRGMTLREVYPYWVLSEVPVEDLPAIAANDMLAGNMDEEIVAVATLSPSDTWERDRVLHRAFAHLGLPPMTEKEAAKRVALDKMRDVARRLITREEDPLKGANAIYWSALDAGAFDEAEDVDERIVRYGGAFLQLADALEAREEDRRQREQLEELIVEAAHALLNGQPTPEWHSDAHGDLHRGKPPFAP